MQRVHTALRAYVVVIACMLTTTSGCHPSRFPQPFWIQSRPTAVVIEGPGRLRVDASCLSGEQLLGGEYAILDDDVAFQIAVLGTYPSSDNTWTAEFDVPTGPGANKAEGTLVMASAFCFTTRDYPLNVTTVTGQSAGAGVPFSTVTARCPDGSTLVGGGYHTGSSSGTALYNTNVMASAPIVEPATQRAVGWQIGLAYVLHENIPQTTVYARCAGSGLEPGGAVVAELDATTLGYAYGPTEWEARCPTNTFTTAGGYSLVGDALIPHAVPWSQAREEYLVWRYNAWFGYQTTSYNFRPCDRNTNPRCALYSAIAACVPIPKIPFVKITITAPANGASYGPAGTDQAGNPVTAPITFTAEAFDEAGSPLSGSAIQWRRDGLPFGSGTTFTAQLPASKAAIVPVVIRATATGATTSASDQITLQIGQIQ